MALAFIIGMRPVIPVASPGIVLLLTIAVAAVIGGIAPALVSAAITAAFVLVDASIPGQLFSYAPDQLSRLVVNLTVAPAMAVLVGGIHVRANLQQQMAAARQSEDRQRALTDPAPDAIVTVDSDSIIRSANPATEQLFGVPVQKLIGRSLTELMPDGFRPRHRAGLKRYIETGEKRISWQGVELVGRHSSGREFPVEVSFGEYGRNGDRRFTGIIRDITVRKDLEAQLLQAQKMEAIGQLAGGVAHDFNNMLTAISGFAELLADHPDDSELRDTAVEGIRQAATRSTSLTRQLLAFSRRQHLEPSVISLDVTIARVEPLLRRLIGENIELVVKRTRDPWTVIADPAQIETVVMNLAINARDAMPDGGVLTIETANIELDEAYAQQHVSAVVGQHAMIAVSDSGIGMDDETLSHIWEPFFTTKGIGQGTGLGLSSVYGVVKQSNGNIWVYSEPGRGTTFKVYLPRAETAESERIATLVDSPQRGQGTILVAEDEAVVRDLLVVMLQQQGYRVLTTIDGREALELLQLRGGEIDLIISDVVMPNVGGLEFVDRAAQIKPGLPAILISGYTANALPQGQTHNAIYLEKPFTSRQLGDVVRRALDQRVPT